MVTSSIGNLGTESRKETEVRQMRRFKLAHVILGVTEIVVGIVMFSLDIAAIIFVPFHFVIFTYSGVCAGLYCMVTGICGVFAGVNCNRCWIAVCMAMCILASIVCFCGICGSVYEYASFVLPYDVLVREYFNFIHIKNYIIIGACLSTFIITTVHASLCCKNICDCCNTY